MSARTEQKVLYKYRRYDQATAMVQARELYFALAPSLNDPLDCQISSEAALDEAIASEKDGHVKEILERLRKLQVTDRETGAKVSIHQALDNMAASAAVLSMAGTATDALLWAHYAEGHKGVCIGFDLSFFHGLLDRWEEVKLIGLGPVTYASSPPLTDLLRAKAEEIVGIMDKDPDKMEMAISTFREAYHSDFLIKMLTTKSSAWAYEKEHRSIRWEPGVLAFPPAAVRQIIFGMKVSQAQRDELRGRMIAPEWRHVTFWSPRWQAGTFDLALDPVK